MLLHHAFCIVPQKLDAPHKGHRGLAQLLNAVAQRSHVARAAAARRRLGLFAWGAMSATAGFRNKTKAEAICKQSGQTVYKHCLHFTPPHTHTQVTHSCTHTCRLRMMPVPPSSSPAPAIASAPAFCECVRACVLCVRAVRTCVCACLRATLRCTAVHVHIQVHSTAARTQ